MNTSVKSVCVYMYVCVSYTHIHVCMNVYIYVRYMCMCDVGKCVKYVCVLCMCISMWKSVSVCALVCVYMCNVSEATSESPR